MLSPEQLDHLSQLILSDDDANQELALMLLEQYPEHIPLFQRQLEITAYLLHDIKEEHSRIRSIYRRFCQTHFGIVKHFAIFRKMHIRTTTEGGPTILRLLQRYEAVRGQYEPFIAKSRRHCLAYADLAFFLAQFFPKNTYADYYFRWFIAHHTAPHPIWSKYGHYCYRQGRMDEAKTLYERAFQENPNAYEYLGQLGSIAFYTHNYQAAIAYFEQSLAHSQNNSHVFRASNLSNLAHSYLLLDAALYQTKVAELIEQALQASSNAWSPWLIKGIFLRQRGDLQGAIDAYQRGLRQYPYNAKLLGNLAELYAEDVQRYSLAENCYERLLNNSDDPNVYHRIHFVNLLVHQMGNLAKAYPIYLRLRRYFKEQPDNPLETHSITPERWQTFERAGELLQRWKQRAK